MAELEASRTPRQIVLDELQRRFGLWVPRAELLDLCRLEGHDITDQRIKSIKSNLVAGGLGYVIATAPRGETAAYALLGYPAARRQLPAPPEAFRGRQRELGLVKSGLQPGAVVTLRGLHGYGKSAIAKVVMQGYAEGITAGTGGWPSSVEYLGLTADHRDERCLPRLARDLGIPQPDAYGEVSRVLSQPGRLVVIDQAEFSLKVCAALATELTAAGVAVLVTSSELLGVRDEIDVPVSGLDFELPCDDQPEDIPDAVGLFLDHLSEKTPTPTAAQIATIAGLCEQRNGNPLLISLAAGGLDGLRGLRDLADEVPSADFMAEVEKEFDRFGERQRQALARLSLLHNPWSFGDDAVSIAGLHERDLRAALAPLVGTAVQRVSRVLDDRPRQFVIDPYIQQIARRRLNRSKELRDDAVERLVELVTQWTASAAREQVTTFWEIEQQYGTIMHVITPSERLADRAVSVEIAERLLPYWQVRGLFVDADLDVGGAPRAAHFPGRPPACPTAGDARIRAVLHGEGQAERRSGGPPAQSHEGPTA